jgi:arabinofuranosyltransferase
MHGRMLLPAIFAVATPFAVVAVPRRRAVLALAGGVAAWALVCGLALRVSYDDGRLVSGQRIVDERAYYVGQARGPQNPITLEDYSRFAWEQQGADVRRRAARGERTVTFKGPNEDLPSIPLEAPARTDLPVHMVAAADNVGVFGYAAGRDVWVVDRLGLGDPLAARIKLYGRNRPGHEKLMPVQWVLARFADPAQTSSDGWVNSARHALDCSVWWWDGTGVHREDKLRPLLDAVSKPITPGRFISNVKFSLSGANFRFPGNPPTAELDLCGPFH